jgi:hypothetical protein
MFSADCRGPLQWREIAFVDHPERPSQVGHRALDIAQRLIAEDQACLNIIEQLLRDSLERRGHEGPDHDDQIHVLVVLVLEELLDVVKRAVILGEPSS